MLAEAIVGHLVGDYILQNDYLAMNKKQSSWVCGLHCLIWTTSVCLFGQLGLVAAAVLFITHFGQDRTNIVPRWMDLVGQKSFRTGPCSPWSVIVVDNVLHILTIFLVVKLIH